MSRHETCNCMRADCHICVGGPAHWQREDPDGLATLRAKLERAEKECAETRVSYDWTKERALALVDSLHAAESKVYDAIAAREKAEAGAAEMREALKIAQHWNSHGVNTDPARIERALSSDAGSALLAELEELRKKVSQVLAADISIAMEHEREECAKLVEAQAVEHRREQAKFAEEYSNLKLGLCSDGKFCEEFGCHTLLEIAQAIRSRSRRVKP